MIASFHSVNRPRSSIRFVPHLSKSRSRPEGYRGAFSQCHNNRVVLKHADGHFTAYMHIRKGSTFRGIRILGSKVRAGQPIARVGNSGHSSEPHLRFLAYRIDKTGRIRSVPVTFTNAFHDVRGAKPVKGVPLSGTTYHFRSR